MSWVILILLYLCVGCLIVSFVLRPDKSYRKHLNHQILLDGGVTFRIVIMVMTMILIIPVTATLFTLGRPFAVMKNRKEMEKRMSYHMKYRKLMGYGGQITGICELCHKPYAHVHHIEPKGMGGRKNADEEDNLIGLCVGCHEKCHGKEAKIMMARCQGAIAKRKKYFEKKLRAVT